MRPLTLAILAVLFVGCGRSQPREETSYTYTPEQIQRQIEIIEKLRLSDSHADFVGDNIGQHEELFSMPTSVTKSGEITWYRISLYDKGNDDGSDSCVVFEVVDGQITSSQREVFEN